MVSRAEFESAMEYAVIGPEEKRTIREYVSQEGKFRWLLMKYIRHVHEEEGTDFLRFRDGTLSEVEWTDEEWQQLRQLAGYEEPETEEV